MWAIGVCVVMVDVGDLESRGGVEVGDLGVEVGELGG